MYISMSLERERERVNETLETISRPPTRPSQIIDSVVLINGCSIVFFSFAKLPVTMYPI